MKNKIIKILLLALTLIMIFGTVAPVAYESYDTYTYSIDGEALPSPHAYTPDVETYDSTSMGLLAGYYWCYDKGRTFKCTFKRPFRSDSQAGVLYSGRVDHNHYAFC